jgi:hypothetical protein
VAECSDPQYLDQTSCEAGSLSWNDIVINSDSIINTAILDGLAGNYVYCSDCHQESVTRNDKGVCSDPAFGNEVECIYECTNSSYTTQVECMQNGFTWDVPSGETWTADGYCNDIRYSTESTCLGGTTPVWYAATLGCSDPQYPDQSTCEGASSTPVWYEVMPYSIHGKYNGVGIYSFSERHHQAEIWTGTCSNAGITDEAACYQDGSIWTPTYTPGNTFVGNGNCAACHKDPRKAPYARSVCQETSYIGNDAGCIGAGLAVYGGTCSDPQYLNTYDCTDNGGSWSGGTCMDYSKDELSCTGPNDSWIAHPAGASKALPAPKQLPCVTCHSDVDAAGDQLTIYKKKTSVQVDPLGTYGGWTHTPSGPVANTVLRGCAHDNQSYSGDEALCNAEPNHSWYAPLSVCFDETYKDRTSCEGAGVDYHWETPCSDNQYDDAATCVGYCSDPQYISEPDCTAALETWTGSTNFDSWEGTEHQWDVDGYCSDLQYDTESACTGALETWYGGNIQSYGACIFCHKMRPYHAYPGLPPEDADFGTVDVDDSDGDGIYDPPHYPYASKGILTVFYGKQRKLKDYYKGTGQQGNKTKYQAIRDADALPDNSVSWWANVIYDPQSDPTGMVPTAAYCSDPSLTASGKAACEGAGEWWRPGHRLGEPEYFHVPTFDLPIGTAIDAITIVTGNGGTEYDARNVLLDVVAEIDSGSTGVIYAIWAGVKKPMTITGTQGSTNEWSVQYTAADGITDLGDNIAGRVYVINVDESGDNYDLLDQAYYDLQ